MTRLPKQVQFTVDQLRKFCETEPAVEWIESKGHWRVTVENDRVMMTLDHKITSGGRWVWGGSTLTIDGKRGPLTEGLEHFVRVWRNPEEMANRKPVPPPMSTPITAVPLASLPYGIAQVVKGVTEKKDLPDPITGYVDKTFWAVEFSFDRSVLRVHWRRSTNDPNPTEHVYLIVDGVDRSEDAQGSLAKALAVIAKTPHPGVAGAASVEGASGSQRDRGVEVRGTHVIRS